MKKDLKLKCECGGGEILYIGDFEDGQIYVAIAKDPKKKRRYLPGVIVNRKDLLKWLS